MPEHTIPEPLIEQIRSGRAILVVGAGLGLATWKQLLEQMNETLTQRGGDDDEAAAKDVAKLLHKGSLVRAVGFLARTLGDVECDRVVGEQWKTPDELPSIVAALARLPFRQVWTTFPGDVLETGMRANLPEDWPAPEVITYRELDQLNKRRRTLLKVLGDFSSYVVTPTSVRKALAAADDLREHARSYYASGALVFVGFRYGDPDLAALLDRLFGMFEPPQGSHYLIASGVGPVTVDELMSEHHIEVINLPGKGADDVANQALESYLDQLAHVCETAGISLTQTTPSADDLDGWLGVFASDPDNTEAQKALEAIEAKARQDGDATRQIEVLMGIVEHEPEAGNRAVLLRQLATIYEEAVGDLPGAFTALTAALREDSSDTTTLEAAERLAAATDGWAELVADVSAIASEIDDTAVAADYWTRLGHWYLNHLKHKQYAEASYRQALKLQPDTLNAHAGLAEVYRKEQRWPELAEVLKNHVELATETDKKVDLYLALGDLCETQLASTARAIEAYQAAADLDDSHDDALGALERLYKRDERWGKLATVLERRAQRFDEQNEDQRASALRRELATLRAEKLGDVEGAISKYEAALEANGEDIAALRALEDLYEKVGRSADYLRTLERLAVVVPESDRGPLLRRLAAEFEEREGGRQAAIGFYERVLEIEPSAEDAHRALGRLYRAEERWGELASTLERHIAIVTAPGPKADLYRALGGTYETQLQDLPRAIESLEQATALASEDQSALESLARLYERTESWDQAATTLVALAGLLGAKGAHVWCKAGGIAADKVGDLDAAERHYENALETDPTHVESHLGLAKLHEARSSYVNAIKSWSQAAADCGNRLDRIGYLLEGARVADKKLDDQEQALALLLRVLEHDSEHVAAGLGASRRLLDADEFARAVPLLEMLVRKCNPEDKQTLCERECTLGNAYRALDRLQDAATHFKNATSAAPTSLDAALGLGNVLFALARDGSEDRWHEIDTLYRETLARHRATLSDTQVTSIWHQLGVAARGLGDDRKAEDAFRRALERDPAHAPSLNALLKVAETLGDWRAVIDAKQGQLAATTGDDAKQQLFEELAELHRSKMQDNAGAIAVCQQALAERPQSRGILHKLLELHSDAKDWTNALRTLDTLADGEANEVRRSKYHYAAAVIARDEVNDKHLAIKKFNEVLDAVPDNERAFESVDELMTASGQWRDLARVHRRMLKRVGQDADPAVLLRLWSRLGNICLEHLDDSEGAITALEVASSLDPDDIELHEQLANLYLEAGESRRPEAIEELQILIANDPDRVELYRALSNLYDQEQEQDKAFCLAQALVLLGAATEVERARFREKRPQQLVLSGTRLTEELWQTSIIHQSENRHVNAIFASLIGSIAATTAKPASSYNLSTKERAKASSDSVLASVFRRASTVLALEPEPQLYVQAKSDDGFRVANTSASGKLVPSVVIGAPHVERLEDRQIAFEVGKKLAYFRPEHYVNYALQTLPKLETAYHAALIAAGNAQAETGGEIEKMTMHLRNTVPAPVLEQVNALAQNLSVGNGLIANWRTATDLTANRVGLILCNDLETAARTIATETSAFSTMPAKDRLRDLIAYSVSEEYFTVRRHLGLTITA